MYSQLFNEDLLNNIFGIAVKIMLQNSCSHIDFSDLVWVLPCAVTVCLAFRKKDKANG